MATQSRFVPTRGAQPADLRQDVFLGVDYRRELSQLPQRGKLADAENMIFPGGLAKRCGGLTQVGDTISGTSATSGSAQTIRGMYEYNKLSDSTKEVLTYAAGVMYKLDSGSFVEAGKNDIVHTSNYDMDMINANDYLYACNGDEYHLRYDGTTWVEQSSKPVGTMVVEWHDRLWWSGNDVYPSRLYFSDLGDYDTYTGSNYIDFKPNDGEAITALGVSFDNLVIFKESVKGYYNGTSISEYPMTGSVNHKSVGVYNRRLYYPGRDNIYELNGTEIVTIGDPMRPLWDGQTINGRTGANTGKRTNTAGIVFNERYYMALTRSGSAVNDEVWVFDVKEGWWAPWRDPSGTYFKFTRFATYHKSDGTLGLLGGTADGKVWELNIGNNFDNDVSDAAIPAYITTGQFTGDTPHKKKRCLRVLVKGKATGTTRLVQLSYQREQDASMVGYYKAMGGAAALQYDTGYNYDEGHNYATNQGGMINLIVPGKWRAVQLRAYYTEASATFYINNITLHRVRADRFAL